MEVYNKNRDKNNGMRDEIHEQNLKLKNASLKEKASYFVDYYLKATIAIICALIFIGAMIHSIVSGPDDTVFEAYFFNDSGNSSDNTLADNFAAYMNIDTNKHDVVIDATPIYYDETNPNPNSTVAASSYEVYTYLQKTMATISAKDLDIITGDEATMLYFSRGECLADLTTVLSAEQLSKYKDYFYYFTNEESGETIPVGIIINDAAKIKEYHYYDYCTGILGFVCNSEDLENAKAFLDYIFAE